MKRLIDLDISELITKEERIEESVKWKQRVSFINLFITSALGILFAAHTTIEINDTDVLPLFTCLSVTIGFAILLSLLVDNKNKLAIYKEQYKRSDFEIKLFD
jgi:hypothetical protein